MEQALALWRGAAFAEVADEPWAVAEAARLEGLRTVARERLAGAMLACGRAVEAGLAAESLTREHPLREEPWRLLALALYAAGRQADALAALRRARAHLVDELGLDPGPALSRLELTILSHRVDVAVAPPDPARDRVGSRGRRAARCRDGFVGRRDQLEALHATAQQAHTGASTTVALVVGDPGGGKSTLLARFGGELSSGGWDVVTGRCPEAGGAPAAWPWMQVTRALAAGADPVPASAALAPLLRDDLPDAAVDASFGRFVLRRALGDLLADAARRRPLAILFDDLHRADEATLELLAGVADDVTGVPLVLVGTTRSSWPGTEVPAALSALAARSPVRVNVPGFGLHDAAEVVSAVAGIDADAETVRALVERTGGNAFYLVESTRLLGSEGSLVALSRVPDGVRDVLRRRFRLLPAVTVEVLRLAAVVGRDVDVEVLLRAAAIAGGTAAGASLDDEAVVGALESGVVAGLLVEPGPGEVRFAHVVVRETLYDDVPGVRRSRWHAGVADAIAEVRPGEVAALAHHLYRSGTAARARAAVDAAVAAADQAVARYAPERAVELYEQALQALDRLSPDAAPAEPAVVAERAELLSRCGRAQLAAGAGVAALETRAAAALAAERSGDDRLLVRVLTAWDLPTPWSTRAYGTFDHHLVALLERCLRIAGLEPAERCHLLRILVREVAGQDQARASAAALEAEALAREVGDPVLVGLALDARGVVLLHDSDLDARLALADELCAIGQQAGLAVFAHIGHEFVVQWATANAELATLRERVERIDALVRTYRWRQAASVVAMHHGVLAHVTGDLDAADRHYGRAAEVLRRNGGLDADWVVAIAMLSLAVTRGRAGDLAPLLEALAPFPPPTVDMVAVVLAAAGQRSAAREIRRARPTIGRDFLRSLRLTGRALAIVELEAVDEAADVYDQLTEFEG